MMDPPLATVGLADKLTQERRREIFKDEGAVDQNRMMHTERTPRQETFCAHREVERAPLER